MMSAMQEFDWSYELGMYAGVLVCTLIVIFVAAALVLLVRYLIKRTWHRRSERP